MDFAQKFAPEITKLLADADRDVVRNAAELSHDLSKSEAACFVMTKGLCSYMSTKSGSFLNLHLCDTIFHHSVMHSVWTLYKRSMALRAQNW